MPADDIDDVLTERWWESSEHGATHVRQSVNELSLKEGNQRAQSVEERLAEVVQTHRVDVLYLETDKACS